MQQALQNFAKTQQFRGKGPLSVALVITDLARKQQFPLDESRFVTDGGGQVLGLGRSAVQAILAKHGIDRVLAEEGGRTSRGSLRNMRAYVAFLNEVHGKGNLNFDIAEAFWIEKAKEFFAGKPLTLRVDTRLGLRAIVRQLMSQAQVRQSNGSGTMVVGTVMQHLVGAKLEVFLGAASGIQHHGSNESDQKEGRTGDFDLGDTSVHVSMSPTEALLRKCRENIAAGKRPIIITSMKGADVAEGMAENDGIADSIDIFEFEQFIATNIHELGQFKADRRRIRINEIVEKYNSIVKKHETDPSLLIEVATGKG
jgi:Domain of unknown function (DUF4928)